MQQTLCSFQNSISVPSLTPLPLFTAQLLMVLFKWIFLSTGNGSHDSMYLFNVQNTFLKKTE